MTAASSPESDTRRQTTYAELADVIDNLPLIFREARRARGVTGRTAAAEAGLTGSTITRIDQGHAIQSDTLVLILQWLDQTRSTS